MRKRQMKPSEAWAVTVVLALSCLSFSSCSQDDFSPDTSGRQTLSFQVSADLYGDDTRGTPMNNVSGTAGLLGYEFDEWAEESGKSFLMYNEVLQGSGESWKTSKSYLPDAEKTKRFYAYYPYQSDVSDADRDEDGYPDAMIVMSPETFLGYPYFEYTSPVKASDQKDLMYSVSADVTADEDGVLAPVELHFHHLLSALKLTIGNGFDNGTVTRVSLSKIHSKSRFSFETCKWGELEDDDITIYQDVSVKTTTKNTDVLPLTSETQYFMLLPQELENSSVLTVVYNNGSDDFTLTFPLGKSRISVDDGAGGTAQVPLTFRQGKLTTLHIDVESVTKMSVKCTLSDWNSGATFNGSESTNPDITLDCIVDDWDDTTDTDVMTGPQ